MDTFSALLAICAGNSPVPGEFPAQRPVTRSFDVFFDLRLNKRLSQAGDLRRHRQAGDLRRYRAHYDVIVMAGGGIYIYIYIYIYQVEAQHQMWKVSQIWQTFQIWWYRM